MPRLLLTLLVLLLLAMPRAAAAPQPALAGELTVWCMGAEGGQIQAFARRFEQQHPGCRIRTQAIPWGAARDSMITALVGDVAPDVVQMGSTWVPEFAAVEALLPLDDLLHDSVLLNAADFFPASLAAARSGDRLVAIPWYVDTRVVFYRTDLLRAAGWERFPETWQELEALGRTMREQAQREGRTDAYAFSLPVRDEGSFLNLLWQSGGDVLDPAARTVTLDTPQAIAALDFFRRFITSGYAPRDVATQIDPVQAFGSGYFAAWLSGPWTVAEIQGKLPELAGRWAVAMVPGHTTRDSFLGGSHLAIMRGSRNPALAWAFLEFMSLPPTQADWFRATGDLPSCPAAWQLAGLDADPVWSVFHRQIEHSRSAPPVANWQEMVYAIRDAMEESILTDRSSTAISAGLQGKLEAILAAGRAAATAEGNAARLLPRQMMLTITLLLGALLAGAAWWRRIDLWRSRIALLMLLPILIHFGCFLIGPTLASLGLSLTDYDLYSLQDWRRTSFVGLSNYAHLMHDPIFWQAVLNTLYFVGVAGPLTVAVGMLTALGLNKVVGRLRGGATAACFLPMITPMVAVAVVWQWIYAPRDGLLNGVLQAMGGAPVGWLSNPLTAMPALILLAVWKNFGYSMVILLGGLQTIPRELYEAGTIDGTTAWQEFRHITLPLLRPILLFVTVLTTIGFMQFFAEPYIMTDRGGPRNSTLSIVLYLYKEGFTSFRLGYSSAIAYTLCFMIAALSLGQFIFARRKAGSL